MKLDKRIIVLLLLKLIDAHRHGRQSNARKSVTFKDYDEYEGDDSSDYYFNFGDNSSKKRKQTSSVNASKKQQPKQLNLKSALKKNSSNPPKPNQIIFQSNNLHQSTGVFDISRSTDGSNKAFVRDASSIGLENANIFIESNDNADEGPIYPSNPYRNVGPTAQILDDLSPQRFWLPPNAPMTQTIPGPFMPRYVGVPGTNPAAFNFALTSDNTQFDNIQYTGPRYTEDIQVDPLTAAEIAQQTGIGTLDSYRPPYVVPQDLPPLDPVTPIPGGEIIDPLSPQVNNVRGPFFPEQPVQAGPFLFEPQEPQLVGRDLQEGPYIVERVTDPIVFFDPTRGETVLYDPLRDFTRRYNPETDPELPIEDDNTPVTTANNSGTSGATNGAQTYQITPQVVQQQPGMNGGGFLKSMSDTRNGMEPPRHPAFWILKHLDPSELEKSGGGGMNGNSNSNSNSNGRIIFQSPNTKSLHNPQPPKPPSKKKLISHYKAPKQQNSQVPNPSAPVENFRIQLTSTNEENQGKRASNSKNTPDKTEKTDKNQKSGGYRVTLVYRPIVDIDLKKRYGGFKAQGNEASSNLRPSILTTLTMALVFTLILL